MNEQINEQRKRGERCLLVALSTINGERVDSHGAPEDSFPIIAEFFTSYLKGLGLVFPEQMPSLSSRHTKDLMILFKTARNLGQKPSGDNYVDIAGYSGLAHDDLLTAETRLH